MEYPNIMLFKLLVYKFDDYFDEGLNFTTQKKDNGYRKACLIKYDENTAKVFDLRTGYEIQAINFEDLNCDVYDHEMYYDPTSQVLPFQPTKKDMEKVKLIYELSIRDNELIKQNKLIKFKGKLVYEKDSYYELHPLE